MLVCGKCKTKMMAQRRWHEEANTADDCTAVDIHILGLARKELNECAVNHN